MESLLSVEKEIDKALDGFDVFYNEIDNKIDQAIDALTSNVNELNKLNTLEDKLSLTSIVQSNKEKVKEFIKQYSDNHKDLHANISKIGKAIDKVGFLFLSIIFRISCSTVYFKEFYSRFWKFAANKHYRHP